MKEFIKKYIFSFLFILLTYIVISFSLLLINPALWKEEFRCGFSVLSAIAIIINFVEKDSKFKNY